MKKLSEVSTSKNEWRMTSGLQVWIFLLLWFVVLTHFNMIYSSAASFVIYFKENKSRKKNKHKKN